MKNLINVCPILKNTVAVTEKIYTILMLAR
jgi:hypothetical protein